MTLQCLPVVETAAGVLCPRCRSGVELTQPDSETPERLIAICVTCDAWYLVDRDAKAWLLLPDARSQLVPDEVGR